MTDILNREESMGKVIYLNKTRPNSEIKNIPDEIREIRILAARMYRDLTKEEVEFLRELHESRNNLV